MGFNSLTDAESERLALLLEECGEVQQAIGKILRHGYESTHPDGGPTNRQMLERELGDVMYSMKLMTVNGDMKMNNIREGEIRKHSRVMKYLHHYGE